MNLGHRGRVGALLAAVLLPLLLAPDLASARPPMETNQIVDGNGVPMGTAENPLNVVGGGSGGTVTANQGTAGSAPWPVTWGSGLTVGVSSSVLPTGAATAAKQPAFGAAGSPASDVVSIQGVLGGTPQNVAVQDALIPVGSPFSGSAVGTLYTLDTTGYQSIANALTGTFSASVTYESSNDGTNWAIQVGNIIGSAGASSPAGIDSTAVTRVFPVTGRFFRARISAYTSGAVTATPVLRSAPNPTQGVFVGGGAIGLNAGTNTVGGTFGATSAATGGVATIARLPSSANSANLTQVKSGIGRLYKVVACNTTTTHARIKFYNALSANVTVGTTAPFLTRPLPAAPAAGGLNCSTFDMADIGWSFSTGISFALVTGAADNDATAVAAGAITDVSVEVQ